MNELSSSTMSARFWPARHPRWHVHFTPTHSLWLTQVECFVSELTIRHRRRSIFRGFPQWEAAIRSQLAEH